MNANEWAKMNYSPPADRVYADCGLCGHPTDPNAEVALTEPGEALLASLNGCNVIVHEECVNGEGPHTLTRYM